MDMGRYDTYVAEHWVQHPDQRQKPTDEDKKYFESLKFSPKKTEVYNNNAAPTEETWLMPDGRVFVADYSSWVISVTTVFASLDAMEAQKHPRPYWAY